MSRKYLTPIQLPANPTAALEAAPKQYVDGIVIIDPADQIATYPQAELWYDTDDPGLGDLSKLPRGWVGSAYASAALTNVTGTQDIPGCTVTWTADSTRRYMTTLLLPTCTWAGAQGALYLIIANAGGGQLRTAYFSPIPVGGAATMMGVYIESGQSGSQTRKGRVSVATGGNVTTNATTEYAPLIIVEDIGGV